MASFEFEHFLLQFIQLFPHCAGSATRAPCLAASWERGSRPAGAGDPTGPTFEIRQETSLAPFEIRQKKFIRISASAVGNPPKMNKCGVGG